MARSRVVLHQGAIDDLVNDPGVKADVRRRAEAVLDEAVANAPRLTGEYADGLHVEEHPGGEFRVAGSSDHDIYVEAETGNLARSLDAAAD